MPIAYIPNDPGVKKMPLTVITPSVRGSGVAFGVTGLPAEAVYKKHTAEFVAWQALEAANRALAAFEAITGPLAGWAGNQHVRKLTLTPISGQDLNAFYDRNSLLFFQFPTKTGVIYSGASTDVVSHEVGHAIIDSIRPDLWNAHFLEVQALHEGFADCIAIMTALADPVIRNAILAADPDLSKANFVEAIAEQLAKEIGRAIGATKNAAKPRRALNKFMWKFPSALPADGPPGTLINEVHSFGQLTSGCYYDLIREIYRSNGGGEAGLWKACERATKLMAEGIRSAPIVPRFLESVGKSMIVYDRVHFSGTAVDFVKRAFDRHGIALHVPDRPSPRASLGEPRAASKATRARVGGRGVQLSITAKRKLRDLLEAPKRSVMASREALAAHGENLEVTTIRSVDLTSVSTKLKGVTARTPHVALVGEAGGRTAVVGGVDPVSAIEQEVKEYVEGLVRRNLIDFESNHTPRNSPRQNSAGFFGAGRPTYGLKRRGSEVTLERLCFGCRCSDGTW